MATLLLPESPQPSLPAQGSATLAILVSPIRGADGQWRVLRQQVASGQPITALLPAQLQVERIIVNGGVVTADAPLLDGDEVLVIPHWGIVGGTLGGIIFSAVIGLAISAAATALSYVLFPPPKAHNIQHTPEEPSYSFEGIRTSVGPGAPVPVIYGRQRIGGQLLSSSVEQALTIVDDGTAVRRVRALSAPATLSLLLALGEGPINVIPPGAIHINGQPLANFPDVLTYTVLGTADQAPLPTFAESANTFADGRLVAEASGSILYTTTGPIQAFVLNIVFNSGLYAFSPKGERVDNTMRLQYRWRTHPSGAWSFWQEFEVVANRTSVVRFGIRREGLPQAIYDIELQSTFFSSGINAEWQPTLESVTEILPNTQAYPHTALLGLRALATDTLQGALPNITVEIEGRLVRVGSFAAAETYTDNPAWCVMDFLTNTRYGLGIPDAEIDLGAFQAWASYCAEVIDGETRHTFNYTLDRDTRAQQALLEMMGGSRTILLKSEGLWTPRPTRNDLPVQLLSWANCTDLRLTYTRDPERVNVIEARLANEEQDFEQDVLTWPTIEHWPAEVRKTSLEVRGVTKPSRVMRAMQFELNRRRFENLSLEMTCSLDAIVLQPHDLFRFSHPLPGWGTSGRVQAGSSTSFLYLDTPVTFSGLQSYIVYIRHEDGSTEVKPVSYPGDVQASTLTLLVPLTQVPVARTTLWAFGYLLGPADTAVKVFRVIRMQRMSDTTVRLQAMIHNPSIYDEPVASALPLITSLFNPLGPPPALTSLVLTEETRIQTSGASIRVVNLSWDVGSLGPGLAPYGGALILRRTVQVSATGGSGTMGSTELGTIQSAADGTSNFLPLTQVTGHVLDFDDYTIVTGATYVYRVVPISSRGVPNTPGALERIIHIAGPTTPPYFPGTPLNLRLKGQLPGVTVFEGPDVHLEWDPVANTGLFTDTFFVNDYILEVWAPGQTYLLRRIIVAARGVGVTLEFTYTLGQNSEDQIRAGQAGARRDLLFLVWARTNTGRISGTPASLQVLNPAPDMGDMIPVVTALFEAALITFDQFVEPRDFHKYQVFLDTVNPPLAIYEDAAIGPPGPGRAIRKLAPQGLTPGVTYYVYVVPYDTFGPGIPSQIASFIPVALDADALDTIPPEMPTGLGLTTGTAINPDGTVMTWVQANWNLNTEADMSQYEIHFFVGDSTVPTTFVVSHPETSVRLENVGGSVTVRAKLLAYDKFHNASDFTAEASITTGSDTVPPAPPENLHAVGSVQSIALLWTPPADQDYSHCLVYGNQVNNFGSSSVLGTGRTNYEWKGAFGTLGPNETWYFWLRSVDTSGNVSTLTHPAGANAGVPGTAGQLDTTYISSLAVNKLLAGAINVLVSIGVAGKVYLDGPNNTIYIYDDQQPNPVLRAILGKLGPLNTQYGLRLYNESGTLMWNLATGATPAGIEDNAITAGKISAGTIAATHLRTDHAVITVSAQIADALIGDAKIINLVVGKILNGNIAYLWQLGVGPQMFIDGNNANIYVYDLQATPRLRVMLGKLGGGTQSYGLQVWNESGVLMWDFTSGAQEAGIANLAITSAKIQDAAITSAKIGTAAIQTAHIQDLSVGTLKIANAAVETPKVAAHAITTALVFTSFSGLGTTVAETSLGTLAFTLAAGDEVWLVGTGSSLVGPSPARLELRIREDTLTGTIWHQAVSSIGGAGGEGTVTCQHVYQAPIAFGTKTFHLSFLNIGDATTVSITRVSFVGFVRKR